MALIEIKDEGKNKLATLFEVNGKVPSSTIKRIALKLIPTDPEGIKDLFVEILNDNPEAIDKDILKNTVEDYLVEHFLDSIDEIKAKAEQDIADAEAAEAEAEEAEAEEAEANAEDSDDEEVVADDEDASAEASDDESEADTTDELEDSELDAELEAAALAESKNPSHKHLARLMEAARQLGNGQVISEAKKKAAKKGVKKVVKKVVKKEVKKDMKKKK